MLVPSSNTPEFAKVQTVHNNSKRRCILLPGYSEGVSWVHVKRFRAASAFQLSVIEFIRVLAPDKAGLLLEPTECTGAIEKEVRVAPCA